MDPNQIVASYSDEVAGIAARAEEAKERIKNLAGTATSSDGAVTVRVNGSGSLLDVSFGQKAGELPLPKLAAEIMSTARRAQAQASQQILAIMGPLVGEDSDAMRFVREQIPGPDVEPEDEGEQSYPVRRAPSNVDDDDFDLDSPLSREEAW